MDGARMEEKEPRRATERKVLAPNCVPRDTTARSPCAIDRSATVPLMTPALAAQAAQAAIEEELRALQKKERELEGRLRALDKGGKPKPADESDARGSKRSLEDSANGDPDAPRQDNEESRKRVKDEPAAEEPRVTSSVTRPERHVPKESTEARDRNKRLFGRSLLGTLQQAKKETVSGKRKEIEEEIEKKVKEERELQQKLLVEEKEKDTIALEEVKRMRQEKEKQLQEHKLKERERILANFRATAAQPRIYWRPKTKADEAPAAAPAADVPAESTEAPAGADAERPRTPEPTDEPVAST